MGIAPLKGHESIFNTFSKGPFRPGREGEGRGERGTESTQEARAEAKLILIMPSNKEEKTTKSD